jgi:hypothetical protein
MSNNWSEMSDDEIMETIQEAIEEDGRLDPDYIDIEVVNGSVTMSGRVASDEELQIVEDILNDLRVENYKNKIWVDENLGFNDDDEDDNGFRGLSFDDDDEIDEADYSGEDDDKEDDMM